MAAFDLNSLYFLKNAAPKTTSFEEAVAPMEKGFNLGRAYNENYNKNSLQNLIAQREHEGVPFDRLSNEAAKWDLGAANDMRNERRASMEYNYKQSLAEFEQWRKNMARRICGLILQKADELNIPQEQLDQVLNVAASYVVTYDEELAQWLIKQAQIRRYNTGRLNKPEKKLTGKAVDLWTKAQDARKEASQYDPKDNAKMYYGLLNYANAAEAVSDREMKASRESGERIYAEKNDVLRLLSNFKNRDREIDPASLREYALSDRFHLINENKGIDENEDLSDIVVPGEVSEKGPGNKSEAPKKTEALIGEKTPKVDYTVRSMLDPTTIGTFPRISKALFQEQLEKGYGIEDDEKAIKYLQEVKSQLSEDSNRANKGAGKTEGVDKNLFELIDKEIARREEVVKQAEEERRKEQERYKEAGIEDQPSAFKKAFDNMLGSKRTATALNAQMKAFHNVVSSSETSASPLTLINSALLAQLPFYKPTDYDAKVAQKLSGFSTWEDMRAALADVKGLPGPIQKYLQYKTWDRAVDAALMDVSNTFNGMYDNWMKGAKDDNERKEIEKGIRSVWGLTNKDIEIMRGGHFATGEVRERLRKSAISDYGKTYVDSEGNTIDTRTGKIVKRFGEDDQSSGKKIDWDNF